MLRALFRDQRSREPGSVPEVVQRVLKALERDGAIKLERARVLVLDPTALERCSESTMLPAP